MADGSMLSVRSPLNARLDGKAFVQLTLWFLVVLAAYGLGLFLYSKAKSTAGQLSGKATSSGATNPFFG